jgi:transposase
VVNDKLNGTAYAKILEKYLEPYLRQPNDKHPGMVFQDDNAPCHVSGPVIRWQREHGVVRMPWPSQSPDLNPIENLWRHLKEKVTKRRPRPSNIPALTVALQEEWAKIPCKRVRKLIASMPNRTAAVIKAKGGPTTY